MTDHTEHQHFDISPEVARERRLVALLGWYQAMGADQAVAGDAVDWLARGQTPPTRVAARPKAAAADMRDRPSAAGAGMAAATHGTAPHRVAQAPAGVGAALAPATPPAVMLSDDVAGAQARAAAQKAKSLDELHALLASFDGCGLSKTAKNLCFYRGARAARVMIIGEAPGADEDRAGQPFVGRAGKLLDKMLASIGLSEADVHITNVVYWRPPGNRVPTPQETLICRPFLERQIRLVAPEVIVTAGGAAAKLILDVNQGIMKVRGKWGAMEVVGEAGEASMTVAVMPTLHPAYLLRSPAHKRHAWRDLLSIRARLDSA